MIAAVVPVKSLAASKSRLLPHLGRAAAERLALAMLGDVVEALLATRGLDRVAVATPDPDVARERDAAAANECHQLIRPLHPLDLSFVDQHAISKKLSREKCPPSLLLSVVRV
jgi:2-phospho-L-lactate guanylyltransferase (CobY/MobA/RfbA family)